MRQNLIRIILGFCLALSPLGLSASHGAVLLTDADGKLIGAQGVDVAGTLYDVSFVEDSCINLFSGCDAASDFDFADGATALLAAQALMAQVFTGNFDAYPYLTFGCETDTLCVADIPYGDVFVDSTYGSVLVPFALAGNTNIEQSDMALLNAAPLFYDTQFYSDSVFARFTPSVSSVPEPSTWAMMLIGFGAIGLALRRRRTHTGGRLLASNQS